MPSKEDRVSWFGWKGHVTQFSQGLVISNLDVTAGRIDATTENVGDHNCADEDCPK
jgi:hypothetical protein